MRDGDRMLARIRGAYHTLALSHNIYTPNIEQLSSWLGWGDELHRFRLGEIDNAVQQSIGGN